MERHHRKPKSRGGKNRMSNISVVEQTRHRAWHTLFGNLDPDTIALHIQNIWMPGVRLSISRGNYTANVVTCPTVGFTDRKESAWFTLFGAMEEIAIIEEINEVWLDPEYHLRLLV